MAALNPGVSGKRLRAKAGKPAPTDRAGDFLAAWRVIRDSEREHRAWPWPEPEAEFVFHAERHWRFDWAWPARRVAVEVDGGQWAAGGGRHGSDSDRVKLNHAAALGWRVLHFSPKQLADDPTNCVFAVLAALEWKR